MSGREIVPVESGSRALAKPAKFDTVFPDVPRLSESLAQPKRTGYVIIGIFLLGFCLWAATAPLAGGAVATGVVSPNSSRKTVQHLEGGIVRELKVREGDKVAEGQALIILDPLQSSADYKALETMKLGLLARQVRLDAESSGKTELEFPADIEAKPGFAEIAASQRQMFEARRAAHTARKNVLANKIKQLNHQIVGLDAQIESTSKQLSFIREEAAGKLSLVKKGLLPKPEALRLQRGEAELVGRHAELMADAERVRQQIAEATLQITSVEAERLDDIVEEADKVRADLVNVSERLRTSEDVLKRTVITAPVSGTIINMGFKTVGGVLQRGQSILEIVPSDDKLIIDARVSPTDIQRIHPGLEAQVHLLAYSSRQMPKISGIVRSVSPDRIRESDGQQAYYLARVEIDRKKLKEKAPNAQLIAGMPADVMIVAEERTVLEYLLQPLKYALRRAMRES